MKFVPKMSDDGSSIGFSFRLIDILKLVLDVMLSDKFDTVGFVADLDFQGKNPFSIRDLIRQLMRIHLWQQMYNAFKTIYGEDVYDVTFIFKSDCAGCDPFIAEEEMVAKDREGNVMKPLPGVNIRETLDEMDAGWMQWCDVDYYDASRPPVI